MATLQKRKVELERVVVQCIQRKSHGVLGFFQTKPKPCLYGVLLFLQI